MLHALRKMWCVHVTIADKVDRDTSNLTGHVTNTRALAALIMMVPLGALLLSFAANVYGSPRPITATSST
jgi:hypothetical protein